MSIKDNDYVCPKCGESNCIEMDSEIGVDGGCIKYQCEDCGATWNEYFTVRYDGYEFEEKVYDKDGKMIWDAAEERKKWEALHNGSN